MVGRSQLANKFVPSLEKNLEPKCMRDVGGHSLQCSKLKPSYEFHFEGLSNFNPSTEGFVQIQDVNPKI